jgi:hypothetical protein
LEGDAANDRFPPTVVAHWGAVNQEYEVAKAAIAHHFPTPSWLIKHYLKI